jgi:hypothetical protein
MTIQSIRRTSKKRLPRTLAPQSARGSLFRRFGRVERLENRVLLASDFGALPEFRNPILQYDVNNDGFTTAVDALIIINDLNANGPRQLTGGNGGIIGDDGGSLAVASEQPFFVDTNGDGFLTALDVLGVVNRLNAQQGEQVQVRLEATDLNGNPVVSLSPGQEFQLRGFVRDLRQPEDPPDTPPGERTRGVFSAYVDVLFDPALATVDLDPRSIAYGSLFPNGQRTQSQITATAGRLEDIGAFTNSPPYGSQEVLLFNVPMQVTAGASGPLSFIVEDDMSPLFDTTVFGSNTGIPSSEIVFVGDQLTVAEQPAASIADVVASEGNAPSNATLIVTLSAPALGTTTINFATLADTGANPATAGEDYTAATGTVTFAAGESEKTFTIPLLGDQVLEPDETFRVILSTPLGATIADGEALVTIQNDDTPPQITIANTTVVEPAAGTANAVFMVTLSTPLTSAVLVDFATINGSALEPTDYTTTAGTLTFAPGETSRMIVVPVLADAETEGTEQFSLLLANPRGAQFPGGAPTQMATATITEPTAARVILRLEARDAQGQVQTAFEPGDEIHLRAYVTDASAGDPDDQDGVAQMFHDLVYDAGLVSVASTVMFGPSYPDQQNADLGTDGIVDEIGATANLFMPLGGGEILFWEIVFTADAEGLARFQSDPADVTDLHETLIFGEDQAVDPSEIQFGSIDVLIGEGPALAIGDAQATEGNSGTTAMVFEVTLSSPHLVPVTVDFATSDGTATAPVDYQPATGQITFAPGQTSQSITVNVVGDTLLEAAETFFVTLSNPVNADITEGRDRGTGTILDDEVRTISIEDRAIAEGGFGLFTVTLSSPAATPITVNFNTADGTAIAGADYLPAAGTLTFGPGVQTQTITVQTLADDVADDLETFLVQLTGAVGANIDDDTAVGTITEVPLAGLSGFVYVDANGDGQKGPNESGIAGVTVELFGVAVIPGGGTQPVQFTTQTDSNGLYVFENIPSGSYSIHEVQPAIFNDGNDTPGPGGLVTANDWMFVNFAEGGSASGFNFGEAGVRLEFVGKRFFVASPVNGGSPTVDLSNGDVFFSFDGGFNSLNVQALSNTAQAATITILDRNLNVLARSTPSQAAALSIAGNLGQAYFVRIGGGSSSVTLNTLVTGGPHATGLVSDDVFANMDDWLN